MNTANRQSQLSSLIHTISPFQSGAFMQKRASTRVSQGFKNKFLSNIIDPKLLLKYFPKIEPLPAQRTFSPRLPLLFKKTTHKRLLKKSKSISQCLMVNKFEIDIPQAKIFMHSAVPSRIERTTQPYLMVMPHPEYKYISRPSELNDAYYKLHYNTKLKRAEYESIAKLCALKDFI